MVVRDVVGVHDGAGIEVFCVLRHQKSAFMGGAVVFPGGKLDPADAAEAWRDHATEPDARAQVMESEGASARALAVAACREALKKTRIIPLDRKIDESEIDAIRLDAESNGLAAALARRGLRLALDELVPWARWITPEAEQRRFDARFFLLGLPAGQVGRHDDHETTMSFWARPQEVLDRAVRGEIWLAPPTTRTLELLAAAIRVSAARALAREQSLQPICPLFVPDPVAPFLALPGDPEHGVPERRVAGQTRFVLRDGRFVGEDPPAGERSP